MSDCDNSIKQQQDLNLSVDEGPGDELCVSFSDSFDLFDVDYDALHKQAIKDAWKEIKDFDSKANVEVSITKNDVSGSDNVLKKPKESDDLEITQCIVGNTSVDDSILGDISNEDCILLDDSNISKSNVRRSKRKTTASKSGSRGKRKSKLGKKSTDKDKKQRRSNNDENIKLELEKLSKQISKNDAAYAKHNQSDVTVLSDEDEEEINREIRLRIKWGSAVLRIPIRELQPFSEVYRILGEQHNVGSTRILLSHNDKIIPPDLCPRDLNITLADFIEGGILAEEDVGVGSKCDKAGEGSHDSDKILLKVQNSDRKGTITIHIGKREKMKILMLRYAELKKAKLENLRFIFDGEILDPNSTPNSLDLDGGECIDAHRC